jgi:uncharacterized protein YdhG (YjbR/CyaY superfamily)
VATTQRASQTIDAYIANYPPEIQALLEKMRATIRKAAPKAEETINYGVPTFTLGGRNLVHFSATKKHIGFYPTPSAIEAFKAELAGYNGAKGSVQFPYDQRLPLGLITKIVKFRVKEELAKSKQ